MQPYVKGFSGMDKLFSEVEFKRTQLLRARVTPSELKLIQQKASDCGMSTSDYLRASALGKPVRSATAATAITELSQINIRLKNFCREGDKSDDEFHLILKQIGAAIEKLPAKIEDE